MSRREEMFEDRFWSLYEPRVRRAIERACAAHRQRSGAVVDLDDMVSWAGCRVWKLVQDRPNAILAEGLTPEQAAAKVERAASLLARWAYLAHVRQGCRRLGREQATDDLDAVQRLSVVRASPGAFEQNEAVREGLDAIRRRASTTVRGRLAATWPDADERRRLGAALDAERPEDHELRESITEGSLKENTVQQIRSRSLRAARALFTDAGGRLPGLLPGLLLAAALFATSAGNAKANDDDGGEQTGGKASVPAAAALIERDR